MPEPREYTTDEVREKFLAHLRAMVKYWATVPVTDGTRTVEDRISGAVFSTLVALDGGCLDIPGFKVIPTPHKDDKEYQRKRGSNWYPDTGDIGGCLHELFYKQKP